MLVAQGKTAVQNSLLGRIADARNQSDALFDIVRPEAIYDRPIPERHRIIFYVGHLEAFDWNLLHETLFGLKSFDPEFDRLFAFGIDPVGGGLPTDQPSDWPARDQVREYVRKIRSALDEKFTEAIDSGEVMRDGFTLETLLNVAIEHRLMHVETLAYMLHQLPLDRRRNGSEPTILDLSPPITHEMIEVPAGIATLGLNRESGVFGWDNEFQSHTVNVPAFEIDRYMITNRQFMEFVKASGYENRSLWNDSDWDWRNAHSITHPVFWNKRGDGWLYHGMFKEIPLPMDWPVYVSHAEAAAYARWAGRTLRRKSNGIARLSLLKVAASRSFLGARNCQNLSSEISISNTGIPPL